MRELEETTRALWLSRQDSGLSIDRPLFGQHSPSAYLDGSSPPPTRDEIDESFTTVIATVTRLGIGDGDGTGAGTGDVTGEDPARFGRRLAHRLTRPLLPRIKAAGGIWRAGRPEVLVTRTVNWLGIARAEAPATDLGTRISARLGPRAVLTDLRRELNILWGGTPYRSRDQLLAVNSSILVGIARGMLEASIEHEARLDDLLAGVDLLDRTDPDERDAAVAALDAAFDYFAGDELEEDRSGEGAGDAAHSSDPAAAAPFDERVLTRQLAPFLAAADSVIMLLVELGAMLRAFEVAQTRTDALASIVTELTTVRGTSSAAIQRGNRWTRDLFVVSEGLGLVLRHPTPRQARMLNEFLRGFTNATMLRSGVAGLAGMLGTVLTEPSGHSGWQARLAQLRHVALAQKHLPTTWWQAPAFAAGPAAPAVGLHRSAALRMRGTSSVAEQGRAWLAALARAPALSRRDRLRREHSLRLLGRGQARWLRVDIAQGSSRVDISLALGSPSARPLDPAGRPIPLVVFGARYTKYRGTKLLPLYEVGGRLCLSESGEYPFKAEAHQVLATALARVCEQLFIALTAGEAAGRRAGDRLDERPVTISG